MTAANLISRKTKVTKRQQRKLGPNPSNTWQQQPKIKSMEARDKAKLRNAGFTNSRTVKAINPEDDFINSPEYKFGRLLASPFARTRHATILKLKEYLKARTDPSNDNGGLSILDLMKLWKGMWHTLYLCDGVVVQDEVSKVLAELMWSVGGNQEEDEYAGRLYLEMEEGGIEQNASNGDNETNEDDDDEMKVIEMEDSKDETDSAGEDPEVEDEAMEEGSSNPVEEENVKHCRGAHLSALYARTFFRTLTREWSNMDKYRIDKFYTLSRLILREMYRYMKSRHWNLGIIRLFNDALFEEILRSNKFGNGVRFHILDICLDELAKVNSEESTGLPLTEATVLDALEPFFALAQRAEDKIIQQRVMNKVILRFLEEFSIVSDNYEVPEEGDENTEAKKNLIMDNVHVATVGQFIFELASDSETADRYRKGLYDMHKTFMKRIKAVGRDVNIEHDDSDSEDPSEDANKAEIAEEQIDKVEEPNESKKKKKKSKNKKNKSDSSEELKSDTPSKKKKKSKRQLVEEEETHAQEDEISTPKKETPPKKKKKSKRQSVEEEETHAQEDEISTSKKETPSKKKKKSKRQLVEEEETNAQEDEISTSKKETPSKKRKKSKAKKEIELTEEEEEIITISKKEQKAAARAVMKAAKATKAKASRKVVSSVDNPSKKVKFGKMNQSKSFKASMTDLKKVDAHAILVKTPEKSILLKKQMQKKKKRKKN